MKAVGRFEIIGKLGQGSFGTVYRGRDPVINRLVAIKVVSDAVAGDPAQLARFKREAESAGGLNHRNIVTIYELGEHEGRPFIAMEYLEGEDLAHLIAKHIDLPLEQRLDVIVQVAEGLHYAHAHGIVHRDIKPGNIRLLADGTVKIMDFGIARTSDSNMTNTGLILGTVNYMAPEMLQGRPIDARADQFSLGVTAYELLVRRRPFSGDNMSAVLYSIVHENPPPLAELQATPYAALDAIILRCLAKEPDARWPSCQAVAQVLREFLGRPGSVSMMAPIDSEALPTRFLDQTSARSGSSGIRARAGLGTAGTTSGRPLVTGTTPMPVLGTSSTSLPAGAATPVPAAASGRRGILLGAGVVLLIAIAALVGYSLNRPRAAPAPAAGQPAPAATVAIPETPAPGASADAFLAKIEQAQQLEKSGDLAGARERYGAILAERPDHAGARAAAAELDAKLGRLDTLKTTAKSRLAAGDVAAAQAALSEAQRIAPADAALAALAEEIARSAAAAPTPAASAVATPVAGATPRPKPTPETGRPIAAAAEVKKLLAAETPDEAAIGRKSAELRKLDPASPLLGEADRFVQGLARSRTAAASLSPDDALAALAGLDPELPAVRAARQKAVELGRRRDQAQADLQAARAALAAGHLDEAARLGRKSGQDWPPLAAEADRLIERAERPQPTAVASVAAPTPEKKAPADDRPAIERVLAEYAAALKDKDLPALRRIWPGLKADKEKTISSSFHFAKEHVVELVIADLKVNGDSATVTCERHDRIQTNDGQAIKNDARAVFVLRRNAGTWVIEDLR